MQRLEHRAQSVRGFARERCSMLLTLEHFADLQVIPPEGKML
jgi:hypothetical protein